MLRGRIAVHLAVVVEVPGCYRVTIDCYSLWAFRGGLAVVVVLLVVVVAGHNCCIAVVEVPCVCQLTTSPLDSSWTLLTWL